MVSDFPARTYLDHAASTPVAPAVLEKMLPYFADEFGNPSSLHRFGQRAEAAVEGARRQVAEVLNAQPEEILFTSGGSESDNLALRGAAHMARKQRGANHILITPVEHPAVTRTADDLAENYGFEVEYLPVDELGRTAVQDLERRLRPETAAVSVIYGNNEIGTLNPIAELAECCASHGVAFHTDAVQAAAHVRLNLSTLQVDLLSISGHKLNAPKGIGVLFVRGDTPLLPHLTGGAQEFGLRAGTSNTPLVVGLAEGLAITQNALHTTSGQLVAMRDRVISTVLETIPHSRLTGHPLVRLRNHCSFVFRGAAGNDLIALLDSRGFACSSGSACKTGNPEPSEVLLALGYSPDWASGALRVTLGTETTHAELDHFLDALPECVEAARLIQSSPA
jgi:cysteine desulfurase